MRKSSEINLLKAKTMLPASLVAIEGQLRTTSMTVLVILLMTGLFFSVGYFILRKEVNAAIQKRQDMMTAIGSELRKEGLFAALKDRIGIAGRVLEGQRSWLEVLDLIGRITASGRRTAFSVNEHDQVNVNITSGTLEDTLRVAERILSEVADKTIANPILESVQYQKDGTVKVSVTFTPIF